MLTTDRGVGDVSLRALIASKRRAARAQSLPSHHLHIHTHPTPHLSYQSLTMRLTLLAAPALLAASVAALAKRSDTIIGEYRR